MSQSNSLKVIAAIVVFLAASSAFAFQDDSFPQSPNESVSKYSDWLSADAKEFKIRLDVFMPNGDPASGFSARLTNGKGGKVLSPSLPIEGNRVTATLRNLDYGAPGLIELATNDPLPVLQDRPSASYRHHRCRRTRHLSPALARAFARLSRFRLNAQVRWPIDYSLNFARQRQSIFKLRASKSKVKKQSKTEYQASKTGLLEQSV